MAQNVKINGVTYSSVPSVQIPYAAGSGNAEFFDTSGADAAAGDLRNGVKAYGPDGEITGTLAEITAETDNISTKAQVVSIAAGIHTGSGRVQISATEQAKIISANIRSGVSILGVSGALTSVSVVQDSTTKALTIS